MNREEFLKVLEASLLLWDGMPEDEVVELLDKSSVSLALYINNFLRSYGK